MEQHDSIPKKSSKIGTAKPPQQSNKRKLEPSTSKPKRAKIQINLKSGAAKTTPRSSKDDNIQVIVEKDDTIKSVMGFSKFKSTKGKQVPGNSQGGVYRAMQLQYRQYMNRPEGFNRQLSPK
ncbi:hypothetical protein CANCADRAFT_46078 [Tortispora caseinolytica NRRL Y-17796]|uniref:U4/U6.U5 small nuclear ribonucleoprotein 27kDa protein domain-containing protein n=1 Tax=Tortispora caseinolytica NRRL Y-17796 TaxID=767744 RepID=A0A1E4TD37_9ASCO|nr:hypothetical protein CANCADRAFT_46078 [Tortispora caseinolytica NRRL Y-17796]